MSDLTSTTQQKAVRINGDERCYGAFAEIGAGQEVVRWFFQAGNASATVAKTISAYDMAISDAVYGTAQRYVSRSRLQSMLGYEYDLLLQRLDQSRGSEQTFFAFADTVATRKSGGDGWLGIRFQAEPRSAPSEILMHVRMLDKEILRQQEALGIIGVNLVYGAFYLRAEPEKLIASLLDNLTWERVEVDMIRFSGPAFAQVDNRVTALQLVEQGLTEAAMFTADGEVVQWAEALYKKPVLVQRGSFNPYTRSTQDVLERALERFVQEPELKDQTPVVLLEFTLRHLTSGNAIDYDDFLHRTDALRALGRTVLVSNFRRFHRLALYLSRYTDRPLGLAIGASKLAEILDESFYNETEGGLLGGLGQLFKNPTRLYVYPHLEPTTGKVTRAESFAVAPHLRHLYAHLLENRLIVGVEPSDPKLLGIRQQEVLRLIREGDADWEKLLPEPIVALVKREGLFGHRR